MYFFFTIPFWVIVFAVLAIFAVAAFAAGIMALILPYFTAAVTIIWVVALVLVLRSEKKKSLWLYRMSQWLLSMPFVVLLFGFLGECLYILNNESLGFGVFRLLLGALCLPIGLIPLMLIGCEDDFDIGKKEKPIRPFSITLNAVVGLGGSLLFVHMVEQYYIYLLTVLGWT